MKTVSSNWTKYLLPWTDLNMPLLMNKMCCHFEILTDVIFVHRIIA